MGILYYAVNHPSKSVYSLGKNCYASIHDQAGTLSLETRVAAQYEGNTNFTREDTDRIASDLRAYEPFEVVSDSSREDPKHIGYVISGSRFGPTDSDLGTKFFFGEPEEPIHRTLIKPSRGRTGTHMLRPTTTGVEPTVIMLTDAAKSAYIHWITAHRLNPVKNPNPMLQQFLSHTLDLLPQSYVEAKVVCDDTNNPPSVVDSGKIVVNVFFRSKSAPYEYFSLALPVE